MSSLPGDDVGTLRERVQAVERELLVSTIAEFTAGDPRPA
jgi:folate-dependent phosphoribosylglycinamide formyltransferase PurN